jgi:hypothetical protein
LLIETQHVFTECGCPIHIVGANLKLRPVALILIPVHSIT